MQTKKLLVLIFMLSQSIFAVALPTLQVTFKVVDDIGLPVEGAYVKSGFYGKKTRSVRGYTNKEGLFIAKEATSGRVGFTVSKEGYYRWTGRYTGSHEVSGIRGFRRWQPYNPEIPVTLKKIRNPIPLYAARIQPIEIPVLDKFVGFDLLKRDWVTPYGKGFQTDILFKLVKRRAGSFRDHDVTLTVSFPNEQDGIQLYYAHLSRGSDLRLSYQAPNNGYINEEVIRSQREPGKIYNRKDVVQRDDTNYFFRVRTQVDDDGNIENAHYGKIYEPIRLLDFTQEQEGNGKIQFNYYFNPTANDTNLEFDVKRNLFKGLPKNERPGGRP